MKKKYFETSLAWENWLADNHNKETELWLVYFKKHTGKAGVSYDDSVRIALCYGWIDGLVKRLDEEKYARKFTPRKAKSMWSVTNKKRVRELIAAKQMKPAGLKLVEAAKQNGNWDKVIHAPKIDTTPSSELKSALTENPVAKAFFESLSAVHKNQFTIWINMAKREETSKRRIEKSVEMLNRKQKLGLK